MRNERGVLLVAVQLNLRRLRGGDARCLIEFLVTNGHGSRTVSQQGSLQAYRDSHMDPT